MRSLLATAGAVSALGLGCAASEPSRSNAFDLVASFDELALGAEVAAHDLGTPEAREFLLDGWGPNEALEDGTTYVAAQGRRASTALVLGSVRDLELRLRMGWLDAAEPEPPAIHLSWNEVVLGEVEVTAELREYTLEVPASAVDSVYNQLHISSSRPSHRSDGLAVDWIRVSGPRRSEHPRREGDAVVLPPGSWVDLYVEVDGPAGGAEGTSRSQASFEAVIEAEDPAQPMRTRIEWLPEIGSDMQSFTLEAGRASPLLPLRAGLQRLRISNDYPGAPARLRNARWLLGSAGAVVPLSAPEVDTAAALRSARPATPLPAQHTGPNLVLYVIDTLRADRLGVYGDEGGLSPNIDRFADGAWVFENAVAQSSWTKPSMASLFTGRLPPEHGALDRDDRLGEHLETLAETLAAQGYRTGAFVTNVYVSDAFGFDRGFDVFEYIDKVEGRGDLVESAVEEYLRVATAGPESAPWFLYVHTIEPHAPYAPPEPFRSRFAADVSDFSIGNERRVNRLASRRRAPSEQQLEDLRALYAAEVAHADYRFGRFLDLLRGATADETRETAVVVTSDHGEAFWEHASLTHGKDLYRETLHVPLVVRPALRREEARRIDDFVSHVDVFGMLSRFRVGEPISAGEDDLAPVFSHLAYSSAHQMASLVDGGCKLVLPLSRRRHPELFRLPVDPFEIEDRGSSNPVRTGLLEREVRAILEGSLAKASAASLDTELTEETRRQLEALGYLQ